MVTEHVHELSVKHYAVFCNDLMKEMKVSEVSSNIVCLFLSSSVCLWWDNRWHNRSPTSFRVRPSFSLQAKHIPRALPVKQELIVRSIFISTRTWKCYRIPVGLFIPPFACKSVCFSVHCLSACRIVTWPWTINHISLICIASNFTHFIETLCVHVHKCVCFDEEADIIVINNIKNAVLKTDLLTFTGKTPKGKKTVCERIIFVKETQSTKTLGKSRHFHSLFISTIKH